MTQKMSGKERGGTRSDCPGLASAPGGPWVLKRGSSHGRTSVLTEYRDDMALLRKSSSFFGGGTVFPNPT